MAKRKYPSEINTRTVRVNIGDWHLLMELARQHDTTVAKILHLAITGQAKQEQVVTPRTQIPMPVTMAESMPVTMAESMPVTTAYRSTPVTKIAINGSKAAAFKIKPKGVRND